MWLYLAIGGVVLLNLVATLMLLASRRSQGHKWLFGSASWLFPIVGALLVSFGIGHGSTSPYGVGQSGVPSSSGESGHRVDGGSSDS